MLSTNIKWVSININIEGCDINQIDYVIPTHASLLTHGFHLDTLTTLMPHSSPLTHTFILDHIVVLHQSNQTTFIPQP